MFKLAKELEEDTKFKEYIDKFVKAAGERLNLLETADNKNMAPGYLYKKGGVVEKVLEALKIR